MLLTKKQFMEAVRYISGYGGYVDLDGPEAEEMWKDYEEQSEDLKPVENLLKELKSITSENT
jgi:hypothetical protein